MLEEPTPGVHFLLATESSAKLLATVRSRCVSLNLKTPSAELVRQWLSASAALSAEAAQYSLDSCGGAPVAALEMLDAGQTQAHQTVLAAISSIPQADPLDVAQRLESIAPAIWVPILQRWIEDLARVCAGAPARSRSLDYRRLVAIAARSNPVALSQFAQFLAAQRKAVDHPLNPKLFAEAIFVAFSASFSPRQA
jgi:DNA polymerase-3 subunit delta'